MHRIELVTETQPMFHIPGKLHLTWEAPGPVDVDLSTFTEQEKNWLRNGKLKNALKITNLNPEAKKEVTPAASTGISHADALHALSGKVFGPASIPPKTKEQIAQDIKAKAEEMRLKREADSKKTLTAPMPALTRFVEKCGDPLQLRAMREQELAGKNRAKVLKLLDDRIAAVSINVGSIVGAPLGEDAIAREVNLPEIEEELEDPVTIKLGAED
jgi:hypothetical protein